MSLVEVARFADLNEAEIAASFLRANGVSASLAEQHHAAMNPLIRNAIGWIRVMAPASDRTPALTLLAEVGQGVHAAPVEIGEGIAPAKSGVPLTLGVVVAFFFLDTAGAFAMHSFLRRPLSSVQKVGLCLIALMAALMAYLYLG